MKHSRQEEIISIIEENLIETQEELSECLKQRGYNATQATVSRDIRELKLVKLAGTGGKYYYSLPKNDDGQIAEKFKNLLSGTVEVIDRANNITVVKTLAGMAQGAAAAIDSMGRRDIVGSVAGDDTVIIVMRSNEAAQSLCDELKKLIGKK